MVKDHSDSEKGSPLPPHRLLLSINSKGSFICTIPKAGVARGHHTNTLYTMTGARINIITDDIATALQGW